MTGQKRNLLAFQFAHHVDLRGRAPRSGHGDFLVYVKTRHGVESAAADNSNTWFHRRFFMIESVPAAPLRLRQGARTHKYGRPRLALARSTGARLGRAGTQLWRSG